MDEFQRKGIEVVGKTIGWMMAIVAGLIGLSIVTMPGTWGEAGRGRGGLPVIGLIVLVGGILGLLAASGLLWRAMLALERLFRKNGGK